MKADASYRLWYHDDAGCARALVAGEPVTVEVSAYGGNDFVLDFLVSSGLWSVLTGMRPDLLRKENGKPWRALNGVEVLRELARIDRIGHCGRILRDTRLMRVAGFNAEALARARQRGEPAATPETLANHLNRIRPPSAARCFYDHVALLRRKRWIRGTTYAADAHEIIIPYGRQGERLGRVGDKYGYKLVMLFNITPGRERVVGYVLAPLPHSERTLLRVILRALQERFGPVGDWLRTLVLDRGYWGAEYLLGLHRRYGIDLVTRAQHEDLGVVEDLEGLLALGPVDWQAKRERHSRLGLIEAQCAGFERLDLRAEHGRVVGALNAVVADEFDPAGRPLRGEDGQPRPRFYYMTTLPTRERPGRIRDYYRGRWGIENQGFRELTQQWALDRVAGRRFNALNSRQAFALMLYNVERILRMKHPGPWQQERRRLRQRGERDLLAGPAMAAYTTDGRLGLFTPAEYDRLIAARERDRIGRTLREGLAHGQPLERTLERLSLLSPRRA